MLSGLSSLLFGSGGTDAAAVDQTQASLPTTLTTKDDDMGWVLVDTAGNTDDCLFCCVCLYGDTPHK